MFKQLCSKLKGWMKPQKEVPTKQREVPAFKPTPLPQRLSALPIILQEAFRRDEHLSMVLFNKMDNVAYRANKELLEHIHELAERNEGLPFVHDAQLICYFLATAKFAFLNQEKKTIVGFIDKSVPPHLQHAIKIIFTESISSEEWWKTFGVTVKDIRHVRLSHQEIDGHLYKRPVVEWFRHQAQPVDYEDKEIVILNENGNQSSYWIKERGYKVEITERYARLYVIKTDKSTIKRVIKEAKRLKRKLATHQIIISMLDNRQSLPKELEVLKEI